MIDKDKLHNHLIVELAHFEYKPNDDNAALEIENTVKNYLTTLNLLDCKFSVVHNGLYFTVSVSYKTSTSDDLRTDVEVLIGPCGYKLSNEKITEDLKNLLFGFLFEPFDERTIHEIEYEIKKYLILLELYDFTLGVNRIKLLEDITSSLMISVAIKENENSPFKWFNIEIGTK